MPEVTTRRVAYVLALHPAMSATFIQREIAAVEAEGVEVLTISINSPAPHDLLTEQNLADQRRTHYIKELSKWTLVRTVLRAIRRSPRGFLATSSMAIRSGHADLREVIWRLFYLVEAAVVWDLCRQEQIHHLHAHFGQGSACVAWFAADLANRLDADRPHSTWSFTVHGWLEFLNERDDAMKEKVEAADLTFCIADHTRSQLMRLSDPAVWDRIRVVRCGVDIERFPYSPQPSRSEPPRVLTVARFAPEKGHIVLFESVRLLADAGRPLSLRLAGAGAFRPVLEARAAAMGIKSNVEFLGPLSQEQILQELLEADVFCLPSFSEGLPVSLMEALAVGVPSVATAITGVPELIEDGVTGRLVPASRADLLADAIESLLTDSELRRSVQAGGRRRVEGEFVMDRIGPQVAGLFSELLAGSPSQQNGRLPAPLDDRPSRGRALTRVRAFGHRLWLWANIKDAHRARVGFDGVYRIPDPWGMDRPSEQYRFGRTNELLRDAFGPIDRLIEIGAGEGHQSMVLQEECTHLIGLEVSERAISRAESRVPAAEFRHVDVNKPGWSRGLERADVVACCEVLCYMDDVRSVLDEMESIAERGCFVTLYREAFAPLEAEIRSRPGVTMAEFSHEEITWVAAWWPASGQLRS